jgi:hypothetical protein
VGLAAEDLDRAGGLIVGLVRGVLQHVRRGARPSGVDTQGLFSGDGNPAGAGGATSTTSGGGGTAGAATGTGGNGGAAGADGGAGQGGATTTGQGGATTGQGRFTAPPGPA